MKVRHEHSGVWVEGCAGAWRVYPTAIEALVEECKLHLGIVVSRGLLTADHYFELHIAPAYLNKVKAGKHKMPNHWLLKFHIWSGLPLSVLEALTNMESETQPHRRSK